jgi:hypothetical protein
MRISLEVCTKEIAEELVNECEHEELVAFVKQIDEGVATYEFTHALRDHFVAVCEALAEEEKLEDNREEN